MSKPKWYSQPFPPEGASTAEGIRNQLGRPGLDLLTILVRESAQNSWDARLGDRPVDYRINLRTVGAAHANAWRDLLQEGAPDVTRLPLRKSLLQPRIRVIEVSDGGTRGLGGPTRADSSVTAHHDFVSFVRNVGEPRDNELGGGTYGFGKGIFYLLAKSGTVLLYTRCRIEDRYQTRLVGCALWESYLAEENGQDRRYTGRHWWGDTSGPIVEPLVDEDAEEAVRKLGLKPFGVDETGTTVVIIDPKLDELDPDLKDLQESEVAAYLADTIAWQLWPKMIAGEENAESMRFSVCHDGAEVSVPNPREIRPLNLFVNAYEMMTGPNAIKVACGKPKKLLGSLGLLKQHVPPLEPSRASRTAGIETYLHHVCLMRSPELVVTYHEGPKAPSEFLSYAGVFKAGSAVDHTFSRAEPPTHDAWNAQSLEYPHSTFIRTTFKRIREAVDELLGLDKVSKVGSAEIALGAASTLLSPLVGASWGIGAGTDYTRPGATKPSVHSPTQKKPKTVNEGSPTQTQTPMDWRVPEENEKDDTKGLGTPAEPESTDISRGLDVNLPDNAEKRRRRPKIQYRGEPYFDEHGDQAVLIQEFDLPVDVPQEVGIELSVAIAGGEGRETEPPIGAAMPKLLGWDDGSGTLIAEPTLVTDGGPGQVRRVVICPAPDTVTDLQLRVRAVIA